MKREIIYIKHAEKICRKNRRKSKLRMAQKENANPMSYSNKGRGRSKKGLAMTK